MTRRDFLMATGAGLTAATMGLEPLPTALAATGDALPAEKAFLAKLGTNLSDQDPYEPDIEGQLPSGLSGVLYRNGPGLFTRGKDRKLNVLDGDGLVQRFEFKNGRAAYAAKFVRTPKFVDEENADKFKYATWTTRAPGGMFSNMGGGEIKSQAGVTVYPFANKILAFDEVGPPYEIDPMTLETKGPYNIGPDDGQVLKSGGFAIKAHTKTNPKTGDLIALGLSYGRNMTLHIIVHDANGKLKTYRDWTSPRQVYIHDFFATENYLVALLHPAVFNPLPLLTGTASFVDSLSWKPQNGNLVAVFPLDGSDDVKLFEAPPSWMWHALNAYERGAEIIADFTGYEAPDHFLGQDAAFRKVMTGQTGIAKSPGLPRRYIMNLQTNELKEEIISNRNTEFPFTDLRQAGFECGIGFYTEGTTGGIFHDGVLRLDLKTGAEDRFRFDQPTHVGEGVYVPGAQVGGPSGWLLNVCLDGNTERSFLAVFEAANLAAGPVAKVWLRHHTPLSFHGAFAA